MSGTSVATSTRAALIASVALILLATLTPIGAASIPPTSPWCVDCGGHWLADALSNIALFIPLGVTLRRTSRRVAWWWVLGISVALSLGVETLQSIGLPPGRSPTLADVIANACGGLCGFLLASAGRWFRPVRADVASASALGWSVGVAALCWGTSWALTPVSDRFSPPSETATSEVGRRDTVNAIIRLSPLTALPTYGWFAGIVDSATVNGTTFTRSSTGPVIIESVGSVAETDIRVTMHGADRRGALVPLVYLHAAESRQPSAIVGVRDAAVTLVVLRQADAWGLLTPALTMRDVLGDDVGAASRVVRIEAQSRRGQLKLGVHTSSGAAGADSGASASRDGWRRKELALSPMLGWAMLQTLVASDAAYAGVAQLCWIALLMCPIGWWSARAGGSRLAATIISSLVVVYGAASSTARFDLAAVSRLEWLEAAAAMAAGFLASHRELQRRNSE